VANVTAFRAALAYKITNGIRLLAFYQNVDYETSCLHALSRDASRPPIPSVWGAEFKVAAQHRHQRHVETVKQKLTVQIR